MKTETVINTLYGYERKTKRKKRKRKKENTDCISRLKSVYIKDVPSIQTTERYFTYCIKALHDQHGLGINSANHLQICDKRSMQVELLRNRL